MLEVANLKKILPNGKELLKGVTFKIQKGEFVGVLGPSGAGKSLTLRCILGLTRAEKGTVRFRCPDGSCCNLDQAKGKEARNARRHVGVIFQGFNLVHRLSVLENVMVGRLGAISPLRSLIYGFTDKEAEEALKVLSKVGMQGFASRRAGSLSGGEKQRVAIARAMFQRPSIYLADEPISSLDPKNAKAIMKLLLPLAKETPVLGVFHQPEITRKYCTRVVAIRGGEVVYDGKPDLTESDLAEVYGDELDEVLSNRQSGDFTEEQVPIQASPITNLS